MPFASFNPTNPRTNPWNFHKKILRIGGVGKSAFFKSAILNFFFQKKKNFFCLILLKTSQSLLISKDGSNFWWLPWFPAKTQSPQTFQPAVYERCTTAKQFNDITPCRSQSRNTEGQWRLILLIIDFIKCQTKVQLNLSDYWNLILSNSICCIL